MSVEKTQRGRPKSDPESQRAAIFAATMEALVSLGYQKTTTQHIAKASGISKNTLYNYFPSKESLFGALVENRTVAMKASMSKAMEETDLDLEDVLIGFGIHVLSIVTSEVSIAINRSAIVAASSHDLSLSEIYDEHAYAPVVLNVHAVLERARRSGIISYENIDDVTQDLIGLIYGDIQMRLILGVVTAPTAEQIGTKITKAIGKFMKLYGS